MQKHSLPTNTWCDSQLDTSNTQRHVQTHVALGLPDEKEGIANVFVRGSVVVDRTFMHMFGYAIDQLHNVCSQYLSARMNIYMR
jgi:hypothetical protein